MKEIALDVTLAPQYPERIDVNCECGSCRAPQDVARTRSVAMSSLQRLCRQTVN